jgi:hypothetical protein
VLCQLAVRLSEPCRRTSELVEAVNYIFDSLLFAGSVFLLAGGMASGSDESAPARLSASRGRDTAHMSEVGG